MRKQEDKILKYYFSIIIIIAVTIIWQNDVMGCAQQVDGLESQFAARMETLKNTVQSKTAVPTAQVYVSMFWMFKKKHTLIKVDGKEE